VQVLEAVYHNEHVPLAVAKLAGKTKIVSAKILQSPQVYVGATYRFNPEDATAFRMLQVAGSGYLVHEITARCVMPAGTN
jgi:hypothetical protein